MVGTGGRRSLVAAEVQRLREEIAANGLVGGHFAGRVGAPNFF